MLRTKLKNTANENGSTEDIRKHRDQRNLAAMQNRRIKREYYAFIQSKTIENDKQVWKSAQLYFSHDDPTRDRTMLIEGGKIL